MIAFNSEGGNQESWDVSCPENEQIHHDQGLSAFLWSVMRLNLGARLRPLLRNLTSQQRFVPRCATLATSIRLRNDCNDEIGTSKISCSMAQ